MLRRLDKELAERGLVQSRSQAENLIELGHVRVNGKIIKKPAFLVDDDTKIRVARANQFVSRAALKLQSAARALRIDFRDKTLLDVGSSTGGFTEYALKHGAVKSIAVDVGTDQLHPLLRKDPRIELHEKTDIRDFAQSPRDDIDLVVIDVSFVSLREILPSVKKLVTNREALILAMVKPQFEAGGSLKTRGVVKNDTIRREIFKNFEVWVKRDFVIVDKADSAVSGKKGNTERFYLLKQTR